MEYRINRKTGDKISVIGLGTSYISEASEKEIYYQVHFGASMKRFYVTLLSTIMMFTLSLTGCSTGQSSVIDAVPIESSENDLYQGENNSEPSSLNGDESPEAEITAPIVYFTSDISPEGLMAVYEALGVELTGKVAVKISTGEPLASNYLRPELIANLVQYVEGTIVECNTTYGGSRAQTAMHYQVAEDHGFTDIADFQILDEDGSMTLQVSGGSVLTENYVGAAFADYDSYLILSHFKGHSMAGFGGAIKNISIGLGSSEGKAWIHSGGTSRTNAWGGQQDAFLEAMAEAGKSVTDYLGNGEGIVYVKVATKHNKPVIVMEPVKGGTLARVPEEAEKLFKDQEPNMSVPSWAIRFAASLDNVMVVLSGMSGIEQMEDNLSYMEDFKPLTEEEKALCHKASDIINAQIAVPCTGCSYCTEGCPKKIAIPQYFSLYNEDMRENLEEKGWTVNFTNYEILAGKFGKAKDCVACGQCEGVCPQHLPIIEKLKEVSGHFDACYY